MSEKITDLLMQESTNNMRQSYKVIVLTIACSERMNDLNVFQDLVEVLEE